MKIENIKEKEMITKRNISFQKNISKGVVIFSLAAVMLGLSIESNVQESKIVDSEEYSYYSGKYLEYLNTNTDEFDLNFDFIYKNAKYIYNDKEYKGTSIYIVEYDDNTTHLVDANNNMVDLLTEEKITAKRIKMSLFKESSLFYELYKNGIINNNEIELSKEYIEYIKNWNGERHRETKDLMAEEYASNAFKEEFGGRKNG